MDEDLKFGFVRHEGRVMPATSALSIVSKECARLREELAAEKRQATIEMNGAIGVENRCVELREENRALRVDLERATGYQMANELRDERDRLRGALEDARRAIARAHGEGCACAYCEDVQHKRCCAGDAPGDGREAQSRLTESRLS